MKILIHITNGHMDLQSRTSVALWCKKTKNGQAILEMKAPVKDRSLQQNRYYHKVVVGIIADHCGYTPQECHDALRAMFLVETGKLPRIKSTTELSTVEFEEYLSKIREFAAKELETYVLLPNEPACELFY